MDRQTDRERDMMKLIVTFPYFADAPKNQMEGLGKFFFCTTSQLK